MTDIAPGHVMPLPVLQLLDNQGRPLAGGQVHCFAAGTRKRQAVYHDAGLMVPHANPVVLDAAGRATVFWQAASYYIEVRDSDGALIWSQDNVPSTQAGKVSRAISGGDRIALYGTPAQGRNEVAYPSGMGYDALVPGSSIADVPAGRWRLDWMGMVESGGQVIVGLFHIADGAVNQPLVEASTQSTVGIAHTTTPVDLAAGSYGAKMRTTADAVGRVWGLTMIRVE